VTTKLFKAYPLKSGERQIVEDAYEMAESAHRGQNRDDGQLYITHPLAVAQLVQDFGLDTASVAAALLHDVVEDTSYTLADVKNKFGDEVAVLVDALTKVDSIHYQENDLHKAETYRKIILATAKDIRVVIIKLFDRLHNISTAETFEKERRMDYANETLDIYAPIAHRLGFAKIKDQLEDAAFRLLEPERHEEVVAIIENQVIKSEKLLAELAGTLETDLKNIGLKDFIIKSRRKSPYSLNNKLVGGRSLQDIYDIFGLRVITESLEDCYITLGRIHNLWHPVPGRFADYIANPKQNMYQSIHTTVSSDQGIVFEIQVRTHEMNAIAEYGLAAHWHYKRAGKEKLEAIDTWLQDLAKQQSNLKNPEDILETLLSETTAEEIYTFTPVGNVRVLPVGATPVDFAYAVHTSVGNRCTGAKINGRIANLNTPLQTGDIVEILTTKNEQARPRIDWLRFVVTHKAKSQIRKSAHADLRADDEAQGLRALQEAFHRNKSHFEATEEILEALNIENAQELYYRVGSGKLSAKQVLRTLNNETTSPNLIVPIKKKNKGNIVVLDGDPQMDGVIQTVARCCHPLPGDEITAYISFGRGIVIHRADCSNLRNQDTDRLMKASWTENLGSNTFFVSVRLKASDRPRLMEDITHLLAERGASLSAIDMRTQEEVVKGNISLHLTDAQSLPIILGELRGLDGVLMADRARN